MIQYVTPEGIQEGTENILKAGCMPVDGKPSTDCSCPWCWEAHKDYLGLCP